MSTYFIVGASRGIGFEFARQLLEEHKDTKVIAGARNPHDNDNLKKLAAKHSSRLTVVAINVNDPESVTKSAAEITSKHPEGIDYTIVNAGIMGDKQADPEEVKKTFDTNVVGNLRVFQSFVPLIKKSKKKIFISISSTAGSIASQKMLGSFFKNMAPEINSYVYGYRISKAALNCLSAMLAADNHEAGITVIAIHPGTVETDMFYDAGGTPEMLSAFKGITVLESVQKQLQVFHKLTLEDSGKFLDYTGATMPL